MDSLPRNTKFDKIYLDLPAITIRLPVIEVDIPDLKAQVQEGVTAALQDVNANLPGMCRDEVNRRFEIVLSRYTMDAIEAIVDAEVKAITRRSVTALLAAKTRRAAADAVGLRKAKPKT